ncbi:MAG: hypothetical protein HQK76_06040 [Desulfobacterales bacterium]|nr:hypothetical protein [Desulfobacterales bacterium]
MAKNKFADVVVEAIEDRKALQRTHELFNDVYEYINNEAQKTVKHRVKNSIRTFIHTDLKNPVAGGKVGGFVTKVGVAVGVSVAVAAIAATGPVGIGIAAAAALITWGAKKGVAQVQHDLSKKKVIQTIRTQEPQAHNINSQTQEIAVAMLDALVYDLGELPKDYKAYVKSLPKPQSGTTAVNAIPLIDFINEIKRLGGSSSPYVKKRANPSLFRRAFTSESKPNPHDKVRIRVSRIFYYFDWLDTYLYTMGDEAADHTQKTADSIENLVLNIKQQVHYTGSHLHCHLNNLCYGPDDSHLQVTVVSSQVSGVPQTVLDKLEEVNKKPAKLQQLTRPPTSVTALDEDEENRIDTALEKVTGAMESGFGETINGALTSDSFVQDVLGIAEDDLEGGFFVGETKALATSGLNVISSLRQGDKGGALLEGSTTVISTGAKYGIKQATSGMSTVLGAGVGTALTECVDAAVDRVKESFKYNRPVLNKVTSLLQMNATEQQTQIDSDIRELLKKGKPEVMMRLIMKITFHYPRRFGDQATKFKTDLQTIDTRLGNRLPPFENCKQAYKSMSHLLKINRYAEKHLLHIALLTTALEILKKEFAG